LRCTPRRQGSALGHSADNAVIGCPTGPCATRSGRVAPSQGVSPSGKPTRPLKVVTGGDQSWGHMCKLQYLPIPTLGNGVRFPADLSLTLHSQAICGAHPASYLTEGFPRGVKLTTYLYLMPRLRMSGAISPFPHTSSWRGDYLSTGKFTVTSIVSVLDLRF
jgi:hypothetical protein